MQKIIWLVQRTPQPPTQAVGKKFPSLFMLWVAVVK